MPSKSQILINVFDMKDIIDPASKAKLTEKLIEAKDRGVDVVLVTDRRKATVETHKGTESRCMVISPAILGSMKTSSEPDPGVRVSE